MIKKIQFLTLIVFSITSTVSFAQMKDPTGTSCNSASGRIEYLKTFTKSHYSSILSKIENVPPDQIKYFEKEYNDSLIQGNRERFNVVYNHPLYFAWRVRDSYGKFQRVFSSSSVSPPTRNKEEEIILYIKALRAKEQFHDSLKDYIDYDSKRNASYIDNGYFVNPVLRSGYDSRIEELVRCALKH
jgi:hypothetical protein